MNWRFCCVELTLFCVEQKISVELTHLRGWKWGALVCWTDGCVKLRSSSRVWYFRINQLIKIPKSRIWEKKIIFFKYTLLFGWALPVRVSIVVSIPACHAGDRGSIPRHGEPFLEITWFLLPFWHILVFWPINYIDLSHNYHLSNHVSAWFFSSSFVQNGHHWRRRVNDDLWFIWLWSPQCGLAFNGLTEDQKWKLSIDMQTIVMEPKLLTSFQVFKHFKYHKFYLLQFVSVEHKKPWLSNLDRARFLKNLFQ